MTSKRKYAADGIPYTEVRMLNTEDCFIKDLSVSLKPEQLFVDFTFCFKDGTSATFKNAGSLQEFLDKLAQHHELEKKFEIARKALREIRYCKGAGFDLPAQTPWEIIADKALEQIEHIADVSKMIEHKDGNNE